MFSVIFFSTLLVCCTARPIPSEEPSTSSQDLEMMIKALCVVIFLLSVLLIAAVSVKLVRTFFSPKLYFRKLAVQKTSSSIPLNHILADETLDFPVSFVPSFPPSPATEYHYNMGCDENSFTVSCPDISGLNGEETIPMVPRKLFTSYKDMC